MRHRTWSAALAAVAFIMAAAPAHGDNYPVRDGTGASQTFCSKLTGGLQFPCHLIYGMFGSTPTAITTDGTNLNVHVQASELPSGAATSSNQSSQLTQETSVNTVLGTQADSAWSGSGSGSLISLQKYIAAKNEAMRALLAGTLTVSLPTGAAAAANQTAVQANAGSDAAKAVAVQGITGGKPLAVTDYIATTTTDRSITVATGGTAQQLMAANTSRRSFYVFNPNASGTCWGSFTSTTPAANALGSFPLPSLGGFGMETNATTAALYVNCPTTGQFMTAWESQ